MVFWTMNTVIQKNKVARSVARLVNCSQNGRECEGLIKLIIVDSLGSIPEKINKPLTLFII